MILLSVLIVETSTWQIVWIKTEVEISQNNRIKSYTPVNYQIVLLICLIRKKHSAEVFRCWTKNDSDFLIEDYFIIWLYAETKDFCNEFHALSRIGAVRQAFCEAYGFVPPCSVGAIVTLHHVSTVYSFKNSAHLNLIGPEMYTFTTIAFVASELQLIKVKCVMKQSNILYFSLYPPNTCGSCL